MDPITSSSSFSRVQRWVSRGLLLVWAGFWAWFVLAVSIGEEPAPPAWIPLAWLTGLAALVVLAWRWPKLGGIALVGAGIWAASYFPHPGARSLLAAPAIGIGLLCLVQNWSLRRAARAAIVVVALGPFLPGCLAPQDPADLPYRTNSILRHENGAMKRAYLLEPTRIDGFPCQGWIWWTEDGGLESFDLAEAREVQGHAFPAATRLFLDREGHLAHAWLPQDTVIDGRVCRGRWKIDTAFHPNGRIRAFFPPETTTIDGVACTASVFHPVYLHPDGRLRQCKLAADVTIDGRAFERGETIALDESGRPRSE